MAIFTADEFGDAIQRCWFNGKDVTRYATRANIPAVESLDDMPPAAGWLDGYGSVDVLDIDSVPVWLSGRQVPRDEDHVIAGPDSEPPTTRHYGKVRLIWRTDA